MAFQRIMVRGNIGSELRWREFNNGDSVCNFSIAVNEGYRNRSGIRKQNITWFQCAAWNEIGIRIKKYKNKGEPILVEGKMTFNKGNDGKTYPQLIVQFVDFIGGFQQENVNSEIVTKQPELDPDDDIQWGN